MERTAQYINQDDIHFGELTVQETLRFAALCQSSQTRKRESLRGSCARAHPGSLLAPLARPAPPLSTLLPNLPTRPGADAEVLLEEKEKELGITPDPVVAK